MHDGEARVAELAAEIAADRVHGAAWLSVRALRGLEETAGALARRGAGAGEGAAELRDLARALALARPAMAVLRHRVDRVMSLADASDPAALARVAGEQAARAEAADRGAGEAAAVRLPGRRVLTLSRSGTVTAALLRGRPREVLVAESLPGGEGEPLAAELASAGLAARLLPDSALGAAATQADLVLVGADAVLPDGAVINKIGSLLAALAAREAGIPFLVAAAADKVGEVEAADLARESAVPGAAEGESVPLFERVPARLVSAVITERGPLAAPALAALAAELVALSAWRREGG